MNLTLVDVLCPTCLFLMLGSAVPGVVFALCRQLWGIEKNPS